MTASRFLSITMVLPFLALSATALLTWHPLWAAYLVGAAWCARKLGVALSNDDWSAR